MKQTELKIKAALQNNLDKNSYDGTFTKVWASHLSKNSPNFKYRRVVLIPMVLIISLLTLFTVGYAGLSRLTDNINLPFVDDPQVIGRWETVDFIEKIEEFNPDAKSCEEELYLTNLVFIQSGKMLDSFENGNLFYSGSTWTNGTIITPEMQTASKYEIMEINGNKYMFMEWKNGDYILRFLKPKYYVLKQVDAEDYSGFVPTRIEDNIDYEFANNPEMLGLWKSVDIIDKIDDFEVGKRQYEDRLYVKELNILAEGNISFRYMDDTTSTTAYSWTEDLILNHKEKTASKCTIRKIDEETYMFYEWKSGDYIFRGMKPKYYVFKKAD